MFLQFLKTSEGQAAVSSNASKGMFTLQVKPNCLKLFSRSNLLTLFVAYIEIYTHAESEDKPFQELPEVEPEH